MPQIDILLHWNIILVPLENVAALLFGYKALFLSHVWYLLDTFSREYFLTDLYMLLFYTLPYYTISDYTSIDKSPFIWEIVAKFQIFFAIFLEQ